MIEKILNMVMHRDSDSTTVTPAKREQASELTKNNNDESEMQILADKYGELVAGKVIDTTLHDLLLLLPRKRRRVDSYKHLTTVLKQKGITLNITTSRTTKNGK